MIRFTKQWEWAYIAEINAGNGDEALNEIHIWLVLAGPPKDRPDRNKPMWIRYLRFGKIYGNDKVDVKKILREH
jgi:hypothetical protein